MGRSQFSLIKALADAFNDPNKAESKEVIEKYDIRTNTLYTDGRRVHDAPVMPENIRLEFSVEEDVYVDILYDKKRHHILKGTHFKPGTYISIKETKNWCQTGRGLVKEILCVTPGDGFMLNSDYSVVQW